MLHERTSSAINLRMQSSRRHSIRNLKAKVRAMLPIDICPREKRRFHKSEKIQSFASTHKEGEASQFTLQEKKRNKIFEKLSRKEIEEINQNKHYFLGNEESIAFYQSYVRDAYPEMIEHEWTAPQVMKKSILPFAFIPSNLINPQEIPTFKKIASEKKLYDKRSSASKSIGIMRRLSIPLVDSRAEERVERKSREKAEACLGRKQAKEEEQKIKRQINSVHLQRQQSVAEERRQRMLKERSENAKIGSASNHIGKYEKRSWAQRQFAQSDMLNLANKLRRVCLHRRKESSGTPQLQA